MIVIGTVTVTVKRVALPHAIDLYRCDEVMSALLSYPGDYRVGLGCMSLATTTTHLFLVHLVPTYAIAMGKEGEANSCQFEFTKSFGPTGVLSDDPVLGIQIFLYHQTLILN